jgi:hypothetical protein
MNEQMLRQISKVWFDLMNHKRIQVKTVIARISKENLSSESLKDPEVSEQVERFGYYDVATIKCESALKSLEHLVQLGYVDKRTDTIYNVNLHYKALHHLLPYVLPDGRLEISSLSSSFNKIVKLDSRQYKTFKDSVRIFTNQILVKQGGHKYITEFDYSEEFYYKTQIYEVKDKYFDALFLTYSDSTKSLVTELVKPEVLSKGENNKKNWIKVEEIDSNIFLSESKKVDVLIDQLDWKKKFIGIIIHDGKAYIATQHNIETSKEKKNESLKTTDNWLAIPYENFISRIFEDATAEYFKEKHYYHSAKTRYKPPYLKPKEIDVFAEK